MGNILTIVLFSWIVVCKLQIKSDAIYLRDIFFYVKMLSTFYIRGQITLQTTAFICCCL